MNDRIKDLFAFSRKEQRGLVLLLGLLLCILLVRYFAAMFIPERKFDLEPFRQEIERFKAAMAEADSLKRLEAELTVTQGHADLSAFLAAPFRFDPNTLDAESWRMTGLDERTIQSILRYRQKGGKFRERSDLKKIYSMQDSVYMLLEPYINIKKTEKQPVFREKQKDKPVPARTDPKPAVSRVIVDLNEADSATLILLPGIGPSFASRIIRYRDALGGFYDEQQLLEVKGFDSARYNLIKDQVIIEPELIHKMDLNNVEFKEMLRHPYFEYYLVKAIFSYRDQVKRIDSVGQLKNLDVIYEELYEKVENYLIVE